jgi:Na+-translocating ferredoxin:NAD+ oxidoreductase RnfG subunit
MNNILLGIALMLVLFVVVPAWIHAVVFVCVSAYYDAKLKKLKQYLGKPVIPEKK